MLTSLRKSSAAALAAALVFLVACGEGTTLPTTLDTAETAADVAAAQAAFDAPATQSFTNVGYAIDNALLAAGGVVLQLPAAMVVEGPSRPMIRTKQRIEAMLVDGADPYALPVIALGKTFTWDVDTDAYELSDPPREGAPGNGVRFVLYQVDPEFGMPVEPLVEVGYVQLTQTGTAQTSSATVQVVTSGGTTVMEYTATVGGTEQAPAFGIEGYVGTGANQLTFELSFGYSLATETIVTTWRTEMASRGFSSRVQLAFTQSTFTVGAVMQRGLRKVELLGTMSFDNGGTLTVEVGNKLFATMVFPADPMAEPTITNAQGLPLTAEEEETLEAVFDWFSTAFEVPDALLAPVYVLLGFDEV